MICIIKLNVTKVSLIEITKLRFKNIKIFLKSFGTSLHSILYKTDCAIVLDYCSFLTKHSFEYHKYT